jgi:hypothetical protein
MRTYHVAWWNLENLFDEENAVALGRRTDKVFRAIKDDIVGWTPQLRDRKDRPACHRDCGDEHRPRPGFAGRV